jgi:RHS repeat-associated protein
LVKTKFLHNRNFFLLHLLQAFIEITENIPLGCYPFGGLLTERTFSANTFPNSFNAKRDDIELGDEQDYGLRSYGKWQRRFWSVDPLFKAYVYYSPYQFAGNTPIQAIDIEGAEEYRVNRDRVSSGRINVKIVFVPEGDRRESAPGKHDENRKADYFYNNGPAVPKTDWASPTGLEKAVETEKEKVYDSPKDFYAGKGKEALLKEGQGKITDIDKDGTTKWLDLHGHIDLPKSEEITYGTSGFTSGVADAAISAYAKVLLANPEVTATVTGNTSRAGKNNKQLSIDRANDLKEAVLTSARKQGATDAQIEQLKTQITTVGNSDNKAKDKGSKEGSDNASDRTATIQINPK